ncbi:ABC-F type ribosomal protection protein [Jeotgalibacillus sp. ET6]|uniref:ribosomal protection-like ABC-F family protein n=1 Tax=Jeotgalibacillus sp. ET6 TaxID=3037260 RepID=UPI0024182AF2|nr:ABC-F type ribosomal protection protein [Jeotgalibacillus sp. ET6]MDG5471870.1 ABC-F type ribosomal protection protein [Jeotgalibacillus sp. ET6]
MLLLEANKLKKSVKDVLLFEAEQLRIYRGDRIGLTGRNGSGKTSLLSILSGHAKAESGSIISDASCHLLPQLKRTDTTKSGGEITQEYINYALSVKTDILFADEPTTNLDMTRLAHLEQQLNRFQGALVLVSHDRKFLDALCTKIWEIDDQKIKEYKGNYTAYAALKEQEKRQHEEAYDQYVKKKKQLEEAIRKKELRAERATVKPKDGGVQATNSKPYFAKKQKKLQKTASTLETKIEQMEEVEKPRHHAPIKMNLPNEEAITNRNVVTVDSYEQWAGSRLLYRTSPFRIRGGEKIAIIGENGSGKTTFLRSLMGTEPEASFSPSVKAGYFSQNLDILKRDQTILENVMESSVHPQDLIRTVLARLHFYKDEVFKPIHVLSGGERVKAAFAKVFLSDLNLLILDEPTNYLDIEAVEALEELLIDFSGTVLFVSHDRRLIEKVAEKVVVIKDSELSLFEGGYDEYQNARPKAAAERDLTEDERMKLEMRISEVLSRLSLNPSEELDQEFKKLLELKKQLK